MSPLRRRMIEDMQIRNLTPHTQRAYVDHVVRFARHFRKSPEHLGPAEIRTYQRIVGRHIVGFTCRQYDTRGKADGIAAEMNFGGEPAARMAKCLKLNPTFFTGGTAMSPDRGAVDHLQRVQLTAAIRQPLQQDVPRTRPTPAAELPPDRIPVAECLRQVAPWCAGTADPENTIQHPPMVGWRRPPRNEGVVMKGSTIAHSSSVINRETQPCTSAAIKPSGRRSRTMRTDLTLPRFSMAPVHPARYRRSPGAHPAPAKCEIWLALPSARL